MTEKLIKKDVLERAKEAASIEYAPDISYDDWRGLVRELIAEVERLRSAYLAYSQRHDSIFQKVIKRNKAQRIRIKELEAEKERLEAAFLEAQYYMKFTEEEAREALEKIRSGEQ